MSQRQISTLFNRAPLFISSFALLVSLGSAWLTAFRPAHVVGSLSYITLWQLSSTTDGRVTESIVTPAFWIRNVGARPVIVSDLRLTLTPTNSPQLDLYPITTVPASAIDAGLEFNEYERLAAGSPFRSFSLVAEEQWTSHHRFGLQRDALPQLTGKVRLVLQFKADSDESWTTVFEDMLDFGTKPYHLNPMLGGARSIPIYSERWQRRYTD